MSASGSLSGMRIAFSALVRLVALTVSLFLFQSSAYAGSRQQEGPSPFTAEEIAVFAKKVEKAAAARSAYVFLLARQGVPDKDLPQGVEFTHTGLAVYSTITTEQGETLKGYAIHNLYQDDDNPRRSHLAMDYPIDFFSGAQVLKAGVIIPTPALQQRILQSLESGVLERVHNKNYSIVSNPFNTKYQNCTEYVLDILFASIYQTDNIKQIKVNEHAWFQPQEIKLGPLKGLLAPLIAKEFRTSDHSGDIRTTTFGAITDFLKSQSLVDEALVLYP
ncbi:DUF2145 domain-containing protein [Hahella sp. KA22]|uniref:DUF2145 domain-containing protein n=1 Tax=Hahella sp. KA22 TaxID=1628392 RepID=UPI000FDD4D42|nr:DUF2145 domain-containing protein [Hahella sp. KA22]AZZ93827.1 DUF2145 domain-containing protein [Hahella sp. KA22]QAY57200.1 DUF2145 domain-containing protein [Hahella sp. KA22]